MTRLRETLNPEEKQDALGRPTRTRTPLNKHPLRCLACDDLYYVDESAYREFMHAIEADPSDNRFACDRCIEEQAEEEHAHG